MRSYPKRWTSDTVHLFLSIVAVVLLSFLSVCILDGHIGVFWIYIISRRTV